KLSITIECSSVADVEDVLNEVVRLVGQGYISGHAANGTGIGGYRFEIEGEEEAAPPDCQPSSPPCYDLGPIARITAFPGEPPWHQPPASLSAPLPASWASTRARRAYG